MGKYKQTGYEHQAGIKSVAFNKKRSENMSKSKLPEEYQYDSWSDVDWKSALMGLFVIGFAVYGIYKLIESIL